MIDNLFEEVFLSNKFQEFETKEWIERLQVTTV